MVKKTETGKRAAVHVATVDFGSIAAETTAEQVVQVGVPGIVAAFVNAPDGLESGLAADARAVPARNEKQQVVITGGTGGTFTLTFDGQTTDTIPFDGTAAQVELALEGLSNIQAVSVVKNGASDWTIEFLNPGLEDLVALTANVTGVTGTPAATITEDQKGRARDTVLLRLSNVTAGAINPGSHDFKIVVFH